MPFTVVTFNIADLPRPFEKQELQQIPNRIDQIRSLLDGYDYRLVQEDWFQRMTGHPCGHWYWFPSGLTLGTPPLHPLLVPGCMRHAHSGFASGDWLVRKGCQWGMSQGVVFANLHLDSGDEDWEYRQEQLLDVRAMLPSGVPLVLAGDFNTENDDEIGWVDDKLDDVQLQRVVVAVPPGEKNKDHIYVRGLEEVGPPAGKDPALSSLSDHPAIQVTLAPST